MPGSARRAVTPPRDLIDAVKPPEVTPLDPLLDTSLSVRGKGGQASGRDVSLDGAWQSVLSYRGEFSIASQNSRACARVNCLELRYTRMYT